MNEAHSPRPKKLTIIKPTTGRGILATSTEIWPYRSALYRMLLRDLRARYRHTAFGFTWALVSPMIWLLVYSFFFGYLVRFPSDGWPYPLFAITGIVVWTFLSRATLEGAQCLINNTHIISKIYFPRIILPLNQSVMAFTDFVISLALLVPVLLYYDIIPSARVLYLPLILTLAFFMALGAATWFSALNARYRDIGLALPLAVQVWLFCSPVFYSMSIVPESYRDYYSLNPVVGVLQSFRWALGNDTFAPTLPMMLSSITFSLALFISAMFYFHRAQRRLVDTL
ncbi:MAG: ABC transporter permease [Rhodospirillales bacterium]|nr:ABC transporter permease [Rhodospirillales bacterium]